MTGEEHTLRKLLWFNHGCPISTLYGDDGEMQCNRCGIDFKRDNAELIEIKLDRRNFERAFRHEGAFMLPVASKHPTEETTAGDKLNDPIVQKIVNKSINYDKLCTVRKKLNQFQCERCSGSVSIMDKHIKRLQILLEVVIDAICGE